MDSDEEGPGRRTTFDHGGITLSYLDSGGPGPILLALHGHLNEARFVHQGAVPPDLGYRVVALDQRGHGESGHAHSYATDRYVDDAVALLDHLGIATAVLLGHSLGAAVAYLLAARAPARVTAMIVVDIGAVIDDDLGITRQWPRRAASKEDLVTAFGFMGSKQAYVMRHYADGWGVPWCADEMVASQQELNGDHWREWLATTKPALLIHGVESRQLSGDHAEDMAARRSGTTLRHLPGGHAVYADNPDGYAAEVRAFLRTIHGS